MRRALVLRTTATSTTRALLRRRTLSSAVYATTQAAGSDDNKAPLDSLIAYGECVLRTPEPLRKVELTLQCKARWDAGELPVWRGDTWESNPPRQPARAALPPLFMPKDLPSFKDMNTTIPISMLHALAHIELGAIDNYWDTLVRFNPALYALPRAFYHDFLIVASDEARHFKMVDDRLREIDSFYGALPATMALLEHASNTAADLAARIAVVPLVQEARGLDSGERLVHKLQSIGDKASAKIVAQIVFEERSHVSFGMKWFQHICAHQEPAVASDPVAYFHDLVLQCFPNGLPGPFDVEARLAANMDPKWYQPLENKARSYEPATPQRPATTTSDTPSASQRVAAFAASKRKVILAGSVWPERTSSAAGVRSSDLIAIFQQRGFEVLCVSPSRLNDHTAALAAQHNVQCVQADANSDTFEKLLLATTPQLVVFDRFIAEEMYGWQVARFAPDAARVLDLQDVHFIRRAREFLVKKRSVGFPTTLDMQSLSVDSVEKHVIRELAAIHRSDLTLVVSDVERHVLATRFQVDDARLHRCDFFYPRVDDAAEALLPSFEQRKDIAFIGSFKHAPNVDAIEWFQQQILPLFRARSTVDGIPEIHVYGSYANTSGRFSKFNDPERGFRLMGFAPDVHATLEQYRLTVAPLRFGAGVKGKIADSWHVGTPVVATSIGAEGMSMPHVEELPLRSGAAAWGGAIADDPTSFARAMTDLYTDKDAWRIAQLRGVEICNTRYDRDRNADSLMARLEHVLVHKHTVRGDNWMGKILWSEKYRATEYMSRFIRAKNAVKRDGGDDSTSSSES